MAKTCLFCDKNGNNNIIIREKNLKKNTLDENSIDNTEVIIYQILKGKNVKPEFGCHLNQKYFEEIATYMLKKIQYKI